MIGLDQMRLRRRGPIAHCANWAIALLVAWAPHAVRAQPAPLRLELNRLEPRDGLCRVWLVASNAGPEALDPVRLDLVLFGRDGIAARRLAVDIGPLPGNRTVVRLFDVASQPCDGIGQVLMNDILACGSIEAAARIACANRAAPASRIPGPDPTLVSPAAIAGQARLIRLAMSSSNLP